MNQNELANKITELSDELSDIILGETKKIVSKYENKVDGNILLAAIDIVPFHYFNNIFSITLNIAKNIIKDDHELYKFTKQKIIYMKEAINNIF